MITFVIIPIILYFFKIKLFIVFGILTLIDLIRIRKTFLENISSESITMYKEESGLYRWLPRNQWFFNGVKEFIFMELTFLAMLPIRIIYKIIVMACYYDFTNLKIIIISSLYLTAFTTLGEVIGGIIAIKEIINSEEKYQINNFEINDFQENKSSEIFKNIDKFVFYTVLSSWGCAALLLVLSVIFDSEKIFNLIGYSSYPFTIIIFIRFFYDKYFKFLYYIGFIIVSSIINKFFVILFDSFTDDFFAIIIFILVWAFVSSYIISYLFEFFKRKSYFKYKIYNKDKNS